MKCTDKQEEKTLLCSSPSTQAVPPATLAGSITTYSACYIAEWRKKEACCLIWAKHKYIDGEPGWCCWELKDIYGAAHMVLETFGGMEIYKLIGGEEP